MHIDKSDWIYSTKNEAFSIVRRFSEYFFDDKYVPYHPYNQFTEPSLSTYYKNILDKYLKDCKTNGNKELTIYSKQRKISRFLFECQINNIEDLNSLDGAVLFRILNHLDSDKENVWPAIALFLNYLAKKNIVKSDLSLLIPKIARSEKLPTVYSVEEIKRIENAIDTSTFKGK